MRRHLFALASLIAFIAPSPAAAQDVRGHVFTGVSAQNPPSWQAGAGFERVFAKGVGLSVEGGFAGSTDGSQQLTHLTVSGLFHFSPKDRRLDPFVTGGAGGLTNWSSGCGAVAVGGGLNYWARQRIGLRLEVKDHICTAGGGGAFQMVAFRIGVTFR